VKKLGGLSTDAIGKVARTRGFYESAILTHWHEILPEYAAFTCPLKLFKGILTLATNSPSAAHNIKMQGPYLIERINQFFGYGAVKDIKFLIRSFEADIKKPKNKPIKATEKAIKQATADCVDVNDEDLRNSLINLEALIVTEMDSGTNKK
jgi:hypothetical protein